MKLFVGFSVSDDFRNILTNWIVGQPYLNIRWTPASNFHVTLVPPWQEDAPDATVSRLSSFLKHYHPVTLDFRHISLAPPGKAKTMIWATGKPDRRIQRLKQDLCTYLLPGKKEERLFRPHITLARLKPAQLAQFDGWKDVPISHVEQFSRITLFESIQGREGVSYHTVETFNLTGESLTTDVF